MFRPGPYFSPGKLLLSGEYLVLRGARCLSLPTRFGQHLQVEAANEPQIAWCVRDREDRIVYESSWTLDGRLIGSSGAAWDEQVGRTLKAVLKQGKQERGVSLRFQLDHPSEWGLGSSATLVANIAQATQLDALELFFATQKGSGYDVATSFQAVPLIYWLENGVGRWEKVDFDPPFKAHLFFVYLGQKQDSASEVTRFSALDIPSSDVSAVSDWTDIMHKSQRLEHFSEACRSHEVLLSTLIQRPTVQDRLFPDFRGVVKSLGAWGGDFVMAAADEPFAAKAYFNKKGYPVCLSFSDIFWTKQEREGESGARILER